MRIGSRIRIGVLAVVAGGRVDLTNPHTLWEATRSDCRFGRGDLPPYSRRIGGACRVGYWGGAGGGGGNVPGDWCGCGNCWWRMSCWWWWHRLEWRSGGRGRPQSLVVGIDGSG